MTQKLNIVKPSFSGGEFAPSLYSRIDISKYTTGVKTLKNFYVHPHGGISNRPGTIYVATAKDDNKKIRLIPFRFSTVQNYILEFGEYYVRFYTNGAQVVVTSATAWATGHGYVVGDYVSDTGNTPLIYYCLVAHTSGVGTFAADRAAHPTYWVAQTAYQVPTPYAEDDLPSIYYTQSADVMFLVHPDFVPKRLTRYGNTNWVFDDYPFTGGPFMLPNTDDSLKVASSATALGTTTLTATGFLFQEITSLNDGHVGSLWQLTHYIEGQSITQALASVAATSAIKCGGTWRIITHGKWDGTIKVERSDNGTTGWTMLREFSSSGADGDFNANTYGSEDMSDNAEPFYVRVNMTIFNSGSCNVDLTTDPFYQRGIAKITAVATGGATATAMITRTVGLTSATIDFAEGSWSPYRGWPTTVEFSPQDRLMFANTVSEPFTLWMTKIGNYYDFSRSDPLVDSDGITVNLPAREVNGITSLVPLSNIIALTSANEWGIVSSSGEVITPTTILQKIFGYEGSAGVRPLVIGNRAIYVQALNTIIRDLGYELYSDSFTGADISILANHLFAGYSIVEMAYQQNPDRLVWVVRSDGKLLCMTYMREQEIIAWSWHETNQSGAPDWLTGTAYVVGNWITYNDVTYRCLEAHTAGVFADDLTSRKWYADDITAQFESVASIPVIGYNEVWLSVKRGTQRYIERMAKRDILAEAEDQFFVDCGVTYHEAFTITGVTIGTPVKITAPGHALSNNDIVRLDDVTAMPSLNGTVWVIGNVTATTFDLITQQT